MLLLFLFLRSFSTFSNRRRRCCLISWGGGGGCRSRRRRSGSGVRSGGGCFLRWICRAVVIIFAHRLGLGEVEVFVHPAEKRHAASVLIHRIPELFRKLGLRLLQRHLLLLLLLVVLRVLPRRPRLVRLTDG